MMKHISRVGIVAVALVLAVVAVLCDPAARD
jgi:hypothetical protein